MAYNRGDMAQYTKFETAKVKLPSGWAGLVALSDSKGSRFTAAGWAESLADINQLCTGGVKKKSAIVKDIEVDGHKISVAIKRHTTGSGPRNTARSFAKPKAIRNFNTAAKLLTNGISTAHPLAAIERKNGPATLESIYISEYLNDSQELYFFMRDHFADSEDKLELKKSIFSQIGRIFAALHKAGLWHRDAKASNIVVYKENDGEYKAALVDMDGIKRYCFRKNEQRYRWFSKLAATIEGAGTINMSDHLHCFNVYCRLSGIDETKRDEMFKKLMRQSVAARLLIMANTTTAKQCTEV
jgi:hypothetical protein